ncbi:MAG: hypothetical protein HPY64_09910 [Anaerolineae bacterium]|nr:hypothetical protein [Anaerolineae bacterium]
MRRTFLLVVVLALAATALSATTVGAQGGTGKSIYVTARWSDYYKRIEAAGFQLGCDLHLLPSSHRNDLSAVADRIALLDPATDALIIINDSGEGHFDTLATRVDQFVSAGGRVVWLFVFYYMSDNSLNNVLRDRFGVMADYRYLFSGQVTHQGQTLSPLWDGLLVGLPDAVNQGLANNIVVRDRNVVQSTVEGPEGEIITSAHVQKGAGEILFIATPSFYGGSFEADKGIFADDAIGLYDNAAALDRVCQWLSGADIGSLAASGKSTPADALSDPTLFTTPAFARSEHLACGPNDTYFVLTFGGADDVMPLGAASVTVAALDSDTTLDIIPLDDISRGIDYQGLIIGIGAEILEAGPLGIATNLLREIEASVERQSRLGIQQFRVWSPTHLFDPHLRFLIWASHPAGGGVSITSEWHPHASEFPAQQGGSLPAPLVTYPCRQ